ncbi:MAG: aminotransferase class III-fold pyridoxal phosphate-dependent enzyme [Myxococcales bacterium]|nr:aminotransferase class III-fold pyridoxal phosphate-dependent enzyme [Myxococcales bacterium]
MTQPFFFTWSSQQGAEPFSMVGGEGVHFETADGDRILDLGSLVFQANLGHGHPRMIKALKAQADRLALSMPSAVYPEKVEVAERLLAHAPPGFSKVFFTLGGSEAIENAIKIARMVTGRHKLVSRYRSYHGATMGAVSLSGDYRRPPVEPGLVGVVHVEDFDDLPMRQAAGLPLSRIPRTLELEGGSSVAAVFLESVVGANGVLIPPPGYLRQVREACDEHGALLVMDEVLTGFGRTGKWLALEHFDGVVPDMITLGKALTAGYGTLGAVLVHERVAQHFDDRVLYAGLTHYAHPMGIAPALEALRIYEEDGLMDRAQELGSVLRDGLEGLARRFPDVVRANRSLGLLSATDLAFEPDQWLALRRAFRDRRLHVHVRPAIGAFMLSPPLIIDESTLQEGIIQIGHALEEAIAAGSSH